jgi:hypothetical protein
LGALLNWATRSIAWQTLSLSFFEPPPPPKRPNRDTMAELPARQPWWGAPSNELGASVPLRLVLARTDDVAVAVVGATAYSTGVEFRLAVRRRPRSWKELDDQEMGEFLEGDPFGRLFGRPHRGREFPPEILRFGVQFSDGRKATTVGDMVPWDHGLDQDGDQEPPGALLTQGGGRGGNGEWESEFWLWPIPPPGPVAFVVEWPAKKIELSRQEVDAALFLDAAAQSELLWPHAEGIRPAGTGGRIAQFGLVDPHEDGPAAEREEDR